MACATKNNESTFNSNSTASISSEPSNISKTPESNAALTESTVRNRTPLASNDIPLPIKVRMQSTVSSCGLSCFGSCSVVSYNFYIFWMYITPAYLFLFPPLRVFRRFLPVFSCCCGPCRVAGQPLKTPHTS